MAKSAKTAGQCRPYGVHELYFAIRPLYADFLPLWPGTVRAGRAIGGIAAGDSRISLANGAERSMASQIPDGPSGMGLEDGYLSLHFTVTKKRDYVCALIRICT